jgi:hypothetical protein
MREFRITLPNRPGRLAGLMELLGEKGINIRSVAQIAAADTAIVAVIPYDVHRARDVLKESKIDFEEADIVFVDMRDEPGQLGKATRTIAEAGVNIESIYLLRKIGRGESSRVQFGFRIDNLEKAKAALQATEEWAPCVGGGGEG